MKSINRFIKSKRTLRSTFVIIFGAMLLLPVIIYGSIQSSVIAASTGQNIADKAKTLAWGEGEDSKSSPTTAFSEAAKAAGLDPNDDCLRFVQTVILSSGVDPSFPKGEYSHNGGVDEYQTVKYMNDSSKWKKIDTTNKASLQPGDILVSAVNGVGNNHIFIYLGNNKVAAANFEDYYGRIGNLSEEWNPNGSNDKPFYYGDNKYQVFRLDSADDTSSSENTPYYSTIKTTTDGLTKEQLNKFSQNNILFYNPGECIDPGKGSGICGSNTKEKLWTTLRQYFDEVHAAAALGNILHEGGLNPLRWEYKAVNQTNPPTFNSQIDDWNKLYDGTYMKICNDSNFESWYCIGLGDFAITSRLDEYLQYIKENEPELFDYFKDPQYTYIEGDALIDKLGESVYDRLIVLEVKYFLEEWLDSGRKETFENYTNVGEAAKYYSRAIMACDLCKTESEMSERAASAEAMYDELEGFVCTAGSDSDVTLIGDSISLMSRKNLEEKFPNGFLSVESSRHPTSPGDCHDQGGLEVLRTIASGSGAVSTQNYPAMECSKLTVDGSSLKNNVVWALGTNTTGANKGTVDEVIKLVGPNRNLFLVTPYNRNSNLKTDTEKIAQIYRDAASENSNVYVVDWANAIKSNDSKYLNSDGYHPNSEGTKLFASLISNAVSNSGGSSGSNSSSSSSSSSSATGSSSTGVKWDNGWLVDGTMDGSMIEDVTKRSDLGESVVNPIGSYTTNGGKPNKILLHSTEGVGKGLDVYSPDNMYPAHFTINPKDRNVSQHFSIYQPSMSIAKHDKAGPIQIEIVGFSTPNSAGYSSEWDLKNFSDDDWDYLAKLLVAISEETGIPLVSSVSWTDGTERLSAQEFSEYEGVLGHMHAPDNDHTDPGDIWQYLEKAINRQNNGCTTYEGDYPEYDQCDPRWGGDDYGGGGRTICNSACGAASMAMLATVATGQDIFPNDIAKLLGSHYYDKESVHTLDPIVGEHYGFEVIKDTSSTLEETKTKFRDYLQKGYMIHFTGAGCHPGFQGAKCSKGHVIGIFNIDGNDNVMQANSAYGGNQKSSLDEVAQAKTWNEFTAVKGGSGGKNTCDNNFCKKDTGSSSGGLTKEQAEKVAHYYNTQHTPRGCCGLKNCVEFSNFFVSELTTKGTPGGYSVEGDGNQVVHYLVQNGQAEGGTEPKVWAVFSKTDGQHTGVIVGANSDGTYITVEAAYPGWKDGYMDGNGNGRVYADKTFTDGTYEFAYFASNLNNSKLNEILK